MQTKRNSRHTRKSIRPRRNTTKRGGFNADTIRDWVINGNIIKLKAFLATQCITGICTRFNINKKYDDDKEKTLVIYAIEGRKDDILELLLKYGAKVTGKTTDSFTPFHYAVYKGTPKSVQLLVNREPQLVDVPFPSSGIYPLSGAAERNDFEKVKILLKAGASRKIRDKYDMVAQTYSTDDEVRMILNPNATDAEIKRMLKY